MCLQNGTDESTEFLTLLRIPKETSPDLRAFSSGDPRTTGASAPSDLGVQYGTQMEEQVKGYTDAGQDRLDPGHSEDGG